MVFHTDQAAELAAELRGKTLTIPNLWPIFQHWPHAINESLHMLRQNTNEILERWEELDVAGIFMLWIFLWDDEIDGGSSEVAQKHVRINLGVTCANGSDGGSEHNGNTAHWASSIDSTALCPVATMKYFHAASPALRSYLDEGSTISTVLRPWRTWVNTWQIHHPNKVPLRVGGIEVNEGDMEGDLFSLHVSSGSVLNVIPILFHADSASNLGNVMRTIEGMLKSSVSNFDEAAIRIEARVAGSEYAHHMQRYLDICRTTVTGLLTWSMLTKRYGLLQHRKSDGSIKYTL
ncbi:terpene synthase family metal binding domain-containing protein [Penicillium herquei]|nr:terpene synthase family metal binding domain-containing protein [Penicillium herquei]